MKAEMNIKSQESRLKLQEIRLNKNKEEMKGMREEMEEMRKKIQKVEENNGKYEQTCKAIKKRSDKVQEDSKWARRASDIVGPIHGKAVVEVVEVSAHKSACVLFFLSELKAQMRRPRDLRPAREIGLAGPDSMDRLTELKKEVIRLGTEYYTENPDEVVYLEEDNVLSWSKNIQEGGKGGFMEIKICAEEWGVEVRVVDADNHESKTFSTFCKEKENSNERKRLVMILRRSSTEDGEGKRSPHYDIMGASRGNGCQILFNSSDPYLKILDAETRRGRKKMTASGKAWNIHNNRRSR